MTTTKTTIPLGWALRKRTQEIAHEKKGRIQNWRPAEPALSGKIGTVHSFNCGRYSRSCTYTKWEYAASVRCWGAILPNGDLVGLIDRDKFRLKPFRGYKWDVDASGIRLVSLARNDDDYHPNADDIEAGVRVMIGRLQSNAKVRKELRIAARFERMKDNDLARKAKAIGARVCFEDSITAGNCRYGTESFCARHNLDKGKSYTPAALLAISNGDTQRARLAILVAMKQHEKMTKLGAEVFYP
jgi:hypothetical protein